MTDLRLYYIQKTKKGQLRIGLWSVLVFAGYSTIAWTINSVSPLVFCLFTWILLLLFHLRYHRAYYRRLKILEKKFPEAWRLYLEQRVQYYKKLALDDKILFEQRVQMFISEKRIEGIDTEVDDHVKLLVAASAIIPTFAFPLFEYPSINEILIYPNAFNESFQTEGEEGETKNILGMVGDNFLKHTVVLSKPDLLLGFDGTAKRQNVGIHEFVHILDRSDGIVDGIPEALMDHQYALPWMQIIKNEMSTIEKGRSDISPYALTNNAEFLAVVSESFFSNPHKFHQKHPELYEYLAGIFHQQPDR
jgi:hypothetical protein